MKRILTILTTVVMILSMLSCISIAADSSFAIMVQPTVFIGGDIYNIVWATSTNAVATGYVEYTYNGTAYKVYDEENGVIRTNDYIHSVSVPKDHLDGAGTYKATSVKVTARTASSITYGESVSTSDITFTGYHGQEEINIFTISDTHLGSVAQRNMVKDSVAQLDGDPDIIVLNGDIINSTNYKCSFVDHVFPLSSELSGGNIPVLFVRGNHETHGRFSGYLEQYLAGDTGEFYFNFEYGPLSGIALEFGEDKVDSDTSYKGVADYNSQYAAQDEWLKNTEYASNALYRIAFCHGPYIINHFGYNWIEPLDAYGTDILVSGHSHDLEIMYPKNYTGTGDPDLTTTDITWDPNGHRYYQCTDFPILVDGAHANNATFNTSQIVLKNGMISIHGITENTDGSGYTDTIDCAITAGINPANPAYVGSDTDNIVNNAVTSTEDTFTGTVEGADVGFAFTSRPTVFDTGDTYTIAWSTTDGMGATGEVYVNYDGNLLRFTDNGSGWLKFHSDTAYTDEFSNSASFSNIDKSIHSVKIPKKYLEGSSYKVISRHITYSDYINMRKGQTVETEYITFEGYDDQAEVKMLFCSDLNGDSTQAAKLASLNVDYDVLVLGGNIVSNANDANNFATDLLYYTGSMTDGKKTVLFVRGENEALGEYAPYLSTFLKSKSGEFYTKVEYGPVSAIILDNVSIPEAAGGVAFNLVNANQSTWLNEQSFGDALYKVVLSNTTASGYSTRLCAMGADLLVTGSSDVSSFTNKSTDTQNYAVANNGKSDGTVATLITFGVDSISVKALNEDGNSLVSNTVVPYESASEFKTSFTDPQNLITRSAIYVDEDVADIIGKIATKLNNEYYYFTKGSNAFASLEEAFSYAQSNSISNPQIIITEWDAADYMNITMSCKIFTPNYNTVPYTKGDYTSALMSDGSDWKYNNDYEKGMVNSGYIQIGANTTGLVEIYGLNIMHGYIDTSRASGNNLNVLFKNCIVDSNYVRNPFFQLANDNTKSNAGCTDRIDIVNFYIKRSTNSTRLFGSNTVITPYFTFDGLLLNGDTANIAASTNYINVNTDYQQFVIKNSNLRNVVPTSGINIISFEGQKRPALTTTSSVITYDNNIFYNFATVHNATKGYGIISLMTPVYTDVNFTNNNVIAGSLGSVNIAQSTYHTSNWLPANSGTSGYVPITEDLNLTVRGNRLNGVNNIEIWISTQYTTPHPYTNIVVERNFRTATYTADLTGVTGIGFNTSFNGYTQGVYYLDSEMTTLSA